ncbi:MAG: hypothetical protein ACLFVP_08610 [Candidatus Bathyarchaeia archaeon]
MICDECPFRSDCPILEQYKHSEKLFRNGDVEALLKLYDMLELHEAYLGEMRRNILSKINKLK